MLADEQLLFGDPIHIKGIGDLIQPTIREISRVGSDNYFDKLLLPYMVTSENLTEDYKDKDVFDCLFLEQNMILAVSVMTSLTMFFKKDVELVEEDSILRFKIGEDGYLDKENFQEFQEIIRKVHCVKLPEPEKLPSNMTPEKLKIHEKLKFHRRRRAQIEEPTFKEIINTVMHRGSSFLPYEVIGNFTYYQLINSYQVIVGLSNFDEYMGYKLSPNFELKEDVPHWQKIIKTI